MTADRIRGLAGVLVWTDASRFEAMKRFYVERLDLTPRTVKPDFVNFEWAGVRLSIGVHGGVSGPARDPLRVMLNLEVADIRATHARLVKAGVAFSRAPERETWGGLVATFVDPDGNTLQLLELPR